MTKTLIDTLTAAAHEAGINIVIPAVHAGDHDDSAADQYYSVLAQAYMVKFLKAEFKTLFAVVVDLSISDKQSSNLVFMHDIKLMEKMIRDESLHKIHPTIFHLTDPDLSYLG